MTGDREDATGPEEDGCLCWLGRWCARHVTNTPRPGRNASFSSPVGLCRDFSFSGLPLFFGGASPVPALFRSALPLPALGSWPSVVVLSNGAICIRSCSRSRFPSHRLELRCCQPTRPQALRCHPPLLVPNGNYYDLTTRPYLLAGLALFLSPPVRQY